MPTAMGNVLLGQGLLWIATVFLVLSWAAALAARTGRWPGHAARAARLLKRASVIVLVAFGLWLLLFLVDFFRTVSG